MPRGVDTRLAKARQVGPDDSLHEQVEGEKATADYMFGKYGAMGPKDSGTSGKGHPLPGGAQLRKNGEVVEYHGAAPDIRNRPQFKGAQPNEIRLAQMQVNRNTETIGMGRDSGAPGKGIGGATKLVDSGMRDYTPNSYVGPVHSYIDESIKIKKD